MAPRTALALAVITLLTRPATCQTSVCEAAGGSPFQCSVCGYGGSAPIRCFAYNATFDDLAANTPVTSYASSTWTGLTVLAPNALPAAPLPAGPIPHISPNTPDNYAYAASGSATLSPGTVNQQGFRTLYPFGSLRSLYWACSTPGDLKVPTACNLKLTATCINDVTASPPTTYTYSNEVAYAPAGVDDDVMRFLDVSALPAPAPKDAPAGWCTGYQFQATPAATLAGGVVALEIDTVILTVEYGL